MRPTESLTSNGRWFCYQKNVTLDPGCKYQLKGYSYLVQLTFTAVLLVVERSRFLFDSYQLLAMYTQRDKEIP